jgi:hypothetical protein
MLMLDLLFAFGDPKAERCFDVAFRFVKQTFFNGDGTPERSRKARLRQTLLRVIQRHPGLQIGSWLGDD